jgi:hypothetical protein
MACSAFVGAAVLVITLPVPTWVGKVHIRSQREKMAASDRRVQVVTQSEQFRTAHHPIKTSYASIHTAMSVLRMIKLFAWEARSEKKIDEVRETELRWVRYGRLLGLIDYFIGVSDAMLCLLQRLRLTRGLFPTECASLSSLPRRALLTRYLFEPSSFPCFRSCQSSGPMQVISYDVALLASLLHRCW